MRASVIALVALLLVPFVLADESSAGDQLDSENTVKLYNRIVKVGYKNCDCDFKFKLREDKVDVKRSTVSCDRRCSGKASDVVVQKDTYDHPHYIFTVSFAVKGGRGKILKATVEIFTSDLMTGGCASCAPGWSCMGACVFGFCTGVCAPIAAGSSHDDACLAGAAQLTSEACASDCPVGGEENCQTCLSEKLPSQCETVETSFGCLSCILSVGNAIHSCYKEYAPDWVQVLSCAAGKVSPECAGCVCSLGCKIYTPICSYCPGGLPEVAGNGSGPHISSINPQQGSVHGGQTIAIGGTGFCSPSTVTVGGTSCAITSQDQVKITCVTPAHPAIGSIEVKVSSTVCPSANNSGYAYTLGDTPSITAILPPTSNTNPTISITGTKFGNNPTIIVPGTICTATASPPCTCTVTAPTVMDCTGTGPLSSATTYPATFNNAALGNSNTYTFTTHS